MGGGKDLERLRDEDISRQRQFSFRRSTFYYLFKSIVATRRLNFQQIPRRSTYYIPTITVGDREFSRKSSIYICRNASHIYKTGSRTRANRRENHEKIRLSFESRIIYPRSTHLKGFNLNAKRTETIIVIAMQTRSLKKRSSRITKKGRNSAREYRSTARHISRWNREGERHPSYGNFVILPWHFRFRGNSRYFDARQRRKALLLPLRNLLCTRTWCVCVIWQISQLFQALKNNCCFRRFDIIAIFIKLFAICCTKSTMGDTTHSASCRPYDTDASSLVLHSYVVSRTRELRVLVYPSSRHLFRASTRNRADFQSIFQELQP